MMDLENTMNGDSPATNDTKSAIGIRSSDWGIPPSINSKHGFHLQLSWISPPVTITLQEDDHYIFPTHYLYYYANADCKNYETIKQLGNTHMFYMKHCSFNIRNLASTREQSLVQASTTTYTRNLYPVPLLCGYKDAKSIYQFNTTAQTTTNHRLLPKLTKSTIEAFKAKVPLNETEYIYKSIGVDQDYSVTYKQNLPHLFKCDWTNTQVALQAVGTTAPLTYASTNNIIPVYSRETTGSNRIILNNTMTISGTTLEERTVHILTGAPHLREIAITTPTLQAQSDGDATMKFNYTLRFYTSIDLFVVPKIPTQPTETQIYSASDGGIGLPQTMTSGLRRVPTASPVLNTSNRTAFVTTNTGYISTAMINVG